MSGRKLGGGRILGNGKGLNPPQTARRSSATGSSVAPSEGTASLASSPGNPPSLAGDIGASISIGSQGGRRGVADSSALVCPICCEEMVTLLQLNRHIDDLHQELPSEEQDEVKTWFDKQVLKAKRFQPLSHITQKLRGLEVFESNESSSSSVLPSPNPASKLPLETSSDPDELITRKHWQRTTSDDYCTDPTCGKSLGAIAGSINCRHCGKLFCERCTMYQMKLSRSANHEPVRGYWARVCETCFKSREGYNDHTGLVADHTATFTALRCKRVERNNLLVSRLEKRLTKLTRLLADPPATLVSGGSLLSQVSGQKNQRKMIEQSVVTWEDDNNVSKCPFCQQEFGNWTFRRHHCRICGKVVCADLQTQCSTEIGIDIATQQNAAMEKPDTGLSNQLSVEIRMCRDCNHTIFSNREFASSLLHKPAQQKAYETLRQFERGITLLLPSFHRTLIALQQPQAGRPQPSHGEVQDAAKIRKRLVDAFTKYGAAAKRLRDLPSSIEEERKIQKAIYAYASGFLHTNMLPLKSLPALLRSNKVSSSHPLRQSSLASYRPPSEAASQVSSAATVLAAEEKEARERLMVLEEQLFMVEDMTAEATKARRFEEVSALARNKEELQGEIDELKRRVGDVERKWEGVYQDGA